MDVEVVSVASPSGPESFIEEFGLSADPYTDTERMCEQVAIDFLDICTPTHTHLDLVRMAAKRDVDVFIEKPIARTLEEAYEIAEVVAESGISCMVGHVLRFVPGYAEAAELDIGTPSVARARRLSPFPDWGSGDWFASKDKSGGVFVDLSIHDLDYLRWCWGPVERVFARRHSDERAEHGFATLRFKSGAVGYVEASWAQPESRALSFELELAGDDGLVEFSSSEETAYREWTKENAIVESPHEKGGYRRELESFVSALESGIEPAVGAEAAIKSLRLALAVERSADRGEPVSPEEVTP